MKSFFILGAALALAACGEAGTGLTTAPESEAPPKAEVEVRNNSAALAAVLAAQDEKTRTRYGARHPQETLEFFGITPGMTVAETLPGGGWYSKILIPYLGDHGHLVGIDYSLDMWRLFGGFVNEDFLEKRKSWAQTWGKNARDWRRGSNGRISAFSFGTRDTAMDGQVDAVLFIRAMHHLVRFQDKGGFLTQALADTHAMLRPGGIVGVVQHQAPEDSDDTWANGNNGYLKKSQLVTIFEKAGFKFVGESAINENPKDRPAGEDAVWRLPPTLGNSRDDEALRENMKAIGESNRMTVLFRKG